MQRPLVLLLAAIISGIIAGKVSLMDVLASQITFILVLIFLFVATHRGNKNGVLFFIFAAFFLLGCLEMNLYLNIQPGPDHILHHLRKEKQIIDGVICEHPQVSPYKNELIVAVSRILKDDSVIAVQGRVMLSVKDNYPFKYGDAIRCKVRLKKPHNFQNPGGFDYETYLRYRRILVQGFVSEGSDIIVLREDQGNPFRTAIERYRRHLKEIIRANAPSPQGEIIQAMILGDQKEIPDEVREQFNRTGTSHIIAISGFNIGIISAFSFFLLRLLLRSSEYLLLRFNIIKIATLLTFFPITFFVFIAGMGASVVRAAIMVFVFMISILLGKQRDLYNALALSALVILLMDPTSLFDISFQLSFTAVAAILFITPRLSALLPQIPSEGLSDIAILSHKAAHTIFLFIAASFGAILGTLPLIVLYFNRFSNIALPANLVIAPLLGMVALPVSMAIILTDLFSKALTVFFVGVSSLLVDISLMLVRFFDSLPFATFRITTPTPIEIMAYYIMIALAVTLLDRATALTTAEARRKTGPADIYLWIGLSAISLFFLVDGFYLHLRDQDRIHLKITAIDVGQGSATLVQFPGGRKMLIDGGGFPNSTFDVGRYVLAAFLWHERIDHIDTVVLSHPHPDHLNGLIFILENFKVREVWTNGEATGDPSYIALRDIIRKRRLICRSISEQEGTIHLNPVRITVMNPERPLTGTVRFSARSNAVNDNSLVLKLSYGDVRFLIPGDTTGLVESRLMAKGTDLSTDVLIVAHHGGFTSSTESFLKALTPMVAVISCGADNIYGDPHPDVLKRLNRLKTEIFRTDRDGAITLSTDGRNLVVHPYSGVPELIFSRDRVSILAP
jgi:competence protein ComEC